jgi:hypothetical protein
LPGTSFWGATANAGTARATINSAITANIKTIRFTNATSFV